MTPEVTKILGTLSSTSHGQALKRFLDHEYAKINDVSDIMTLEEAKGKQIALKILKKIFAFYDNTVVDDKTKNQYT